jgi:beta-glucanase (GH16 family)
MISDLAAFHTYAVEWTPTTMTFVYDGRTCLVHSGWKAAPPLTGSQPFDQPFVVILTQALGIGTNTIGASTPLPATTLVDYVRVWA